MRFLLPLLLLLTTTALSAQAGLLSPEQRASLVTAEADLVKLSYTMHTDSSADRRFRACQDLIGGLVAALKTPNSFAYDFAELRGVKVLPSPDRSFRLFTWELHVDAEEYRHYGAIQFNSGELKLLPLVDRGAQLRQNPATAVVTNRDWLGYVAYEIRRGGTFEGRPYYFVFGFDRYARLSRQKMLDVLYFDRAGTPTFGLPVFVLYTPEGHLLEDHTRIVLEYSAEANCVLRYDEDTQRITYENIILARGPDGGPSNLPDGSYHALEYGTDGRWHEVSKVFDHVYDKAPVPVAREEKQVDLIGRPRGR